MDVDRRQGLLGLGALALTAGAPAPARAQDPALVDEWSHVDPEVLRLLPNQVTRLSVTVQLNQRRRYQFVIDTGAGRTSLAQRIATEMELPAGPMTMVNGVVEASLAPTARVDTLTVAERQFTGLTTPLFEGADLAADGLLGLDVLQNFRISVDFRRRRLALRHQAYTGVSFGWNTNVGAGERQVRGTRRREDGLTEIPLLAEQVPVIAILDTGSQSSIGNLALMDAVSRRRPELRDLNWDVPIVGVTGQRARGRLGLVQALAVGPQTLRDVPIVFSDVYAFRYWGLSDRPAMLIGADLLTRLTSVTINAATGFVSFGRESEGARTTSATRLQ